MKKILLLLFLILFFSLFNQNSFAQTATSGAKTINVSYDLPYPGILPDNPLYLLKVIRDNTIGLFISDPLKKANYDLLMADKRLVSARALLEKENNQLAITTLSKSGNYFDQAIQFAAKAKAQGKDASSVLDNLWKASQKHQQVIYQMEQQTKGETKYNLELLQVRAKNFQDTVEVVRFN